MGTGLLLLKLKEEKPYTSKRQILSIELFLCLVQHTIVFNYDQVAVWNIESIFFATSAQNMQIPWQIVHYVVES